MDINRETMDAFFRGLQNSFRGALKTQMPFDTRKVSTLVNSSTAVEDYTWLGESDEMREWIGSRVIKQLASFDYSIKNRKFELTLKANRDDLEDDRIGIYSTRAQLMGEAAALWEPRLVADSIIAGASTACYDGQYFFDTDHPVGKDGDISNVSNKRGGSDREAFYMMDLSRTIKPVLFQQRRGLTFDQITDTNSEHVFRFAEFLYGVDARGACGYSFWQLAMSSQTGLSDSQLITELLAMRKAMRAYENDEGRLLGVNPRALVIGPSNQDQFERVLKTQFLDSAQVTPNLVYNAFELIVVPYLP